MQAREPCLQAPRNIAGSKVKNTNFFPYQFFLRDTISNIGTCHVTSVYSTTNSRYFVLIQKLLQNTRSRRLPETLEISWQAPGGFYDLGVPPRPLAENHSAQNSLAEWGVNPPQQKNPPSSF